MIIYNKLFIINGNRFVSVQNVRQYHTYRFQLIKMASKMAAISSKSV